MGYRYSFYRVKKSNVEAVKNLSLQELVEYAESNDMCLTSNEIYFHSDKFLNKTEVCDLGKLNFNATAKRIYNIGVPLFSNEETQKQFSYYQPYVVGKEGLLEAIKIYNENTLNYYKNLLSEKLKNGESLEDRLKKHVEDKIYDLEFGVLDTDETYKYLVSPSWDYEYAVFNLVHILKTIDWEEDTLLFYGH